MKRWALTAALAIALAACDSGPEGPGDITGSIRSPDRALGGAVLEVVSSGADGFSGAGGTKVFWSTQENPAVHRVIVIGESGGDLQFKVSVQDVGGRYPRASVVSLVDMDNLPVPVTDAYKVRFSN